LQKSIDVPSLVVTSIKSSAMQDNCNKQGAALSIRQEKKLKMNQAPNLSCSLQDIMKSQQPDETGSRAPSVAGSGEGTFDHLHKNGLLSSIQRQQEILNCIQGQHQIQCQEPLK
jgi:hypothetical protein